MKQTPPIIGANSALLLAGFLLTPLASQAAPLAYEGFDYTDGTDNLSGLDGGTGWNSAWQNVNNGSASVALGSLAAGAGAPAGYDSLSTGNSCNLPNQRRTGRFLDTSANGPFGTRGYRDSNGNIGRDGTTVYLSFMQQPNGTSAYYEFEFHRGDLGDGGRIAGIGNDQGGDNVHLRAPNGTHTFIGAGDTAVNFYVVRIDFKAGDDDVFVYRNPASATEPAVPTLTRLAAADMSFNGISFGAFNNGRTVAHDEIRFGQTWDDVIVPADAQPAFVSQPQATTTAMEGGSFGLTAVADGHPEPAYQWFKGVDPIPGATSPTLNLSNLQLSDAGDYHLTATNTEGVATTSDATVTVQSAPAGLLAYEGFDYNVGTANLDGQFGGLGWAAAWRNVNSGGGNVLSGNLAAGTNAPNGYDAESLSNSCLTPTEQRGGRLLDTSIGGRFQSAGYIDGNGNIGADGKTLYLSFVQQPNGTSLFYEFEFHKGDLGDPGRIGGVGNDTNNPTVGLRTGGATTLIGPGSTGVNFYVVRIDYKAGNDDVRVYQNPISATEPATATLSVPDASDMSFNGLSLAAWVNGRTVKHDEIRIGRAWSDVVFGTSRRELVWTGDGTANDWDFAANNWDDGVSATQFADGDPVTFDDTGSDTPAVNIVSDVATSSVTVDNNSSIYTFNGSGSIICSGGLTKSGFESLTLNAAASFGSSVVVDEGDLSLNGTATVAGELNLNEFAGTATLGGNNSFAGSMQALAGTQLLSGTNAFAGMVTINSDTTISGPVSINGPGGTVNWIGNGPGASASLTVDPGGSLDITGVFSDAWVIGRDGGSGSVTQNGGTITFDPGNQQSLFIGASAGGGSTASYDMFGGTLEMSNARLGLAIGPITGILNQTAGAINAGWLEVGAILDSGTGIYDLTGGTMTIGAGGITSASGLYEMNLGGGTIAAAADWSSPLTLTLTNEVGDLTIDTAEHAITLSGVINGSGGLVKNGTGTLTLTGFNDFSGPVAVNAGTLAGYGTSDYSGLTVAAGATVSPGENNGGTFYCDSATFAAGSALAIEIDSLNGYADDLYAVGDIDITGAGVSFAEIGTGFLPAGTTLEIINSNNLTGTFAGYPDGSSVSAGANTFTLNYTSSQVILTSTTVLAPYNGWAVNMGLDDSPGKESAFDADPEQDGIANGLEWILGGDPLARDAASLVTASGGDVDGLTLEFTREEASLGNANLFVQWNTDLDGTWIDVPVTQAGGPEANGVVVTVDEGATPDAVSVQIPATNAAGGKLFARILAIQP